MLESLLSICSIHENGEILGFSMGFNSAAATEANHPQHGGGGGWEGGGEED